MERRLEKHADGLLYCSTCHEPVQRKIMFPVMDGTKSMKEMIVPVMCQCERRLEEASQRKRQYEKDMQAVNALRAESLLDRRLANACLKNYQRGQDNEFAYNVASRYVTNFKDLYFKGQGLLFFGDVGTGKSYTAACIANELLNRKVSVVMTSFIKILSKVGNTGVNEAIIQKLCRPKLLILDDLGAERATDYVVENVYNIIDSRYRSGKPLILTTNLSYGYMKNCEDGRYKRIYDRIFSMCYPVQFSGQSWRKTDAVHRFDYMEQLIGGKRNGNQR